MAVNDNTRAVEAIAAALARTRTVSGAGIELFRGAQDVSPHPEPPRLRSVGVANFAISKVSTWMVKNSAKARTAAGVIDLQRRRYMIDFGAYAVLQTDGQEWSGRSGRSLSTLPAGDSTESAPFWLLELLVVLRSATDADRQVVRGVRCRHYRASVEAGHAWTVLPDRWLDDRFDLPIEVWIDDRYIRRVRICAEQRTHTLELWDFGVAVDDLDWTRLPTFRSSD